MKCYAFKVIKKLSLDKKLSLTVEVQESWTKIAFSAFSVIYITVFQRNKQVYNSK